MVETTKQMGKDRKIQTELTVYMRVGNVYLFTEYDCVCTDIWNEDESVYFMSLICTDTCCATVEF